MQPLRLREVTLRNRVAISPMCTYAAAVGIVLFVIIFTATVVQRRLFGDTQAA